MLYGSVPALLVNEREMRDLYRAPYFGIAFPGERRIALREDLPPRVFASVKAHELQHVADAERFARGEWIWKLEARAWWAGLKASPIGFAHGILLSLNRERIALYFKRMWEEH